MPLVVFRVAIPAAIRAKDMLEDLTLDFFRKIEEASHLDLRITTVAGLHRFPDAVLAAEEECGEC